ncbi:FAD-dependent monooxygenase [Marinactinospora endophytica]
MEPRSTTVLISGAGIAGPLLAYWLHRYGFTPVVVEHAPALRAGGHPVDLFEPAMDIADQMGIAPWIREADTTTRTLRLERTGRRPIELDLDRLSTGATERHVEVMRGDLSALLHERTRHDVEYVFGDSVRSLREDPGGVDVEFDHGPSRRFDLVVGADGTRSVVRRLAFGPDDRFHHYVGGHVAVFAPPGLRVPAGRMTVHLGVGRLAAVYGTPDDGEGRAVLLFRRAEEIPAEERRDRDRSRALLRAAFAGEGGRVPELLAGLDAAEDLYFDAIGQVRSDPWHRGRIVLAGDAGYAPGAAVGGGTTVAFVGAHSLARWLARTGGDHAAAFAGHREELRDYIGRAHGIAPTAMRTLLPTSAARVALSAAVLRAVPLLPARLWRALLSTERRATGVLSKAP